MDADDKPAANTQKAGITQVQPGRFVDDRFEVLSTIGEGGMCTVYAARQIDVDRKVALKMLRPHLALDSASVKRFEREAQAISALNHPNIVTVYAFGFWQNRAYMAIELLQGKSLASLIKEKGKLSEKEALPIFNQICLALQHSHDKGIIHRDLKPSNVMLVQPDNQVKVLDFGMAKLLPESGKDIQKLTQTAGIVGTVSYMSPEQCLGQPVDSRSDIYSMGCLMYETLTGKVPFDAATPYATIHMHVETQAETPRSIRPDLSAVVMDTLEKDPQRRTQSFEELRQALSNPGGARVQRQSKKLTPVKRDRGMLMMVAAAAMLGIVCSLFIGSFMTANNSPKGNNTRLKPRDAWSSVENLRAQAMTEGRFADAERLSRQYIKTVADSTLGGPDLEIYGQKLLIQAAFENGDYNTVLSTFDEMNRQITGPRSPAIDAGRASRLAYAYFCKGMTLDKMHQPEKADEALRFAEKILVQRPALKPNDEEAGGLPILLHDATGESNRETLSLIRRQILLVAAKLEHKPR